MSDSLEHRRAPGVDRDRRLESLPQGLDGGDDTIDLLGSGHFGPGPGLDPADVEKVRALIDQQFRLAQERVEIPVSARVEEGVRSPIEDAHHQCPRGDVETSLAQLNEHRPDPTRALRHKHRAKP